MLHRLPSGVRRKKNTYIKTSGKHVETLDRLFGFLTT